MKIRAIIGVMTIGLLSSFTSGVQDGGKELCKAFFPLDEGAIMTYQNFDGKDKLNSTDLYEIKAVEEAASTVNIKIHATSLDKKGKEVYSDDFVYTCANGSFDMSIESMLSNEMMEGMEGIEMTATSTNLSFPSNLAVGQNLPDAELVLAANGMEMMKFNIVDRKVLAIETMETTAGSFECYKISTTTKSKIAFMNMTVTTVEWIAENVGVVRSETYDKSGKLETYRVLSEIKR